MKSISITTLNNRCDITVVTNTTILLLQIKANSTKSTTESHDFITRLEAVLIQLRTYCKLKQS